MSSPDQPTTLADDLIAEHFEASGSSLHVAGIPVSELAARYGTPLFIYHGGIMRRSYRTLAKALGGFATIYYSVKANPAPAIIRLFNSESAGCEIASVGEYRAARAAGVAPEPGWRAPSDSKGDGGQNRKGEQGKGDNDTT